MSEDNVYWEDLPDGWRKRSARRRNESGRWDVTIFTPQNVKIRSRVGLIRHISENQIRIDPTYVNFEQPFAEESSIKSQNAQKFIKEVEEIQKGFESNESTHNPAPINDAVQTLEENKKSVTLSPKKIRYLERQFRKMNTLLPNQLDYLSSQLKCPKSQIELCFSLYEDYIQLKSEKARERGGDDDSLELIDEGDLVGGISMDGEDFEVLNFDNETIRDPFLVVD